MRLEQSRGKDRPPQSEGFGSLWLLSLSPQAMESGISPHWQLLIPKNPHQIPSSEVGDAVRARLTSCPTENGQRCQGPGSGQLKPRGRSESSAVKLFRNEWALYAEGDQLGFSLWRHLLMLGMFGFYKYSALWQLLTKSGLLKSLRVSFLHNSQILSCKFSMF